MGIRTQVTFVTAMNNRAVFERNFVASPCLQEHDDCEILVQEGFVSAAEAYNCAIDKAANNLIVFCHQDILLPKCWLSQLQSALDYLDIHDPNWGVLGSYGITCEGRDWGRVYSSGLGVIGDEPPRPMVVQTLDEIVLILRKSSGLRFDQSLPHFHFYGSDICLRAAERGMRSYAISAFCVHNTHQLLVLPNEFYECCGHIRRMWKHCLPIQTSCIRITKSNLPVYIRRLREYYLRHVRRKGYGATREATALALLSEHFGDTVPAQSSTEELHG